MSAIAEFANAAWPWVAIGIGLAVYFSINNQKEQNDKNKK